LVQNSANVRKKSVNLLRGIVQNVLQEPENEKFRKLKADKLEERLKPTKGALEFLLAMGFELDSGFYVLSKEDTLDRLCMGLEKLETQATETKSKTESQSCESCCSGCQSCGVQSKESTKTPKTDAEIQLEKVQAERKAEIAAFRAKKKGCKAMTKSFKANKEHQKGRVASSSIGRELQFGMKMAKLPEPVASCAPTGG